MTKSNYGKNATVKTPEVGDLWKAHGYTYHIHCIFETSDKRKVAVMIIHVTGSIIEIREFVDKVKKDFTYIGKAKNLITSIFEVENEK